MDIEINGDRMKKKILFVVDERMMGGVSVVLNDLVHLLNRDKYQLDILALHDRGEMLSSLPDDVKLYFGTPYFEAIDYSIKEIIQQGKVGLLLKKIKIVWGLKTGRIEKSVRKERKKIIKENYDVEIAFKDGFTALFTGYGDTPTKVHWLHCAYKTFNPNEKYQSLFENVLPTFDHIVGVATNVVKEFNEIYHLEKITKAIPVAMDVDRIQTLAKQEAKIPLREDVLQLVAIGRAHPLKGYERLLNVMHRLQKDALLKDVELHIFGDGPLFVSLQKQIETLGLQSVVIMEGNIENPYAELKQYDCLLLPSYSEAFGTVITEAFLVGVPVLATRTSASEMSLKEAYGWICENDEAGIYDTLQDILLHRDKIERCKKNLTAFTYANDCILKDIEDILE